MRGAKVYNIDIYVTMIGSSEPLSLYPLVDFSYIHFDRTISIRIYILFDFICCE